MQSLSAVTIEWGSIFQAVTIALIGWAIRGISHTNHSITQLLQWKDDHGKQDDERHAALTEWLKQLDRRQTP